MTNGQLRSRRPLPVRGSRITVWFALLFCSALGARCGDAAFADRRVPLSEVDSLVRQAGTTSVPLDVAQGLFAAQRLLRSGVRPTHDGLTVRELSMWGRAETTRRAVAESLGRALRDSMIRALPRHPKRLAGVWYYWYSDTKVMDLLLSDDGSLATTVADDVDGSMVPESIVRGRWEVRYPAAPDSTPRVLCLQFRGANRYLRAACDTFTIAHIRDTETQSDTPVSRDVIRVGGTTLRRIVSGREH